MFSTLFSAINALELSTSLWKMLIKQLNAKFSKKKGELRTERERIILTPDKEIP